MPSYIVKVHVAHPNFALVGRIEAEQEFHQCGLSASAHAHDGRYLACRYVQCQVLQHIVAQLVVAEGHVIHLQRQRFCPCRPLIDSILLVLFLVLAVVDFAQTLQADFRVLRRLYESDHLIDGRVELADDVLYRRHHTECHIPVDDCCRREKRNQDVLCLVDEESSRLLVLAQCQSFDAHAEQFGLNVLPLPTFVFFAVVEFDFLHPCNHLVQVALFC